jgi:hypothetical protein
MMWIRNNARTATVLVGGSVLALLAVGGIAPRVGLALAATPMPQPQAAVPPQTPPANDRV